MPKTIVSAQLDEDAQKRFEWLQETTGLTQSAVLRKLIMEANVTQIEREEFQDRDEPH